MKIAEEEASVASAALACAAITSPSTSATRSIERSRLLASSCAWRASIRSSCSKRPNTLPPPRPRANNRSKTGVAAVWKSVPRSVPRFRSMRFRAASKRSRRGSTNEASGNVNAFARSSVAMFTSPCNSLSRR